jgi:cbb3-type cytochrome oxidase maturation protein
MWTLTFLVVLSLSLGIGAWLFFVWSVKSGQYDDVEGPKHRMLDDDDEEDAGRPPAAGM